MLSLLQHLRRIARAVGPDSLRHYRRFLALIVVSAGCQALIVLLLFPALGALFAAEYARAGWWVLALVVATAAVWLIERIGSTSGLRLGLAVMRAIEVFGPRAVRVLPIADIRGEREPRLRTLLSIAGTEITSAIVLIVTPIVTAAAYTLALGLGVGILVSWPVGLVIWAAGALLALAFAGSLSTQSRSEEAYSQAMSALDSRLFEFAWLQPTLRTAGRTADGAELVDHEIEGSRKASLKLLRWQIPADVVFSVTLQAMLLGLALVVWVGFRDGTIDGVTAAVLIIVGLRVIEQFTAVSQLAAPVLAMTRTLQETAELVDEATAAQEPEPAPFPAVPTHLQATGLTVSAQGRDLLHDVTLALEPGSVTVVLGASGAGKTTLLRTLAGLITPQRGEISIDGNTAPPTLLQQRTSFVFQDIELGDGTLAENLRAVNPELDGPRLATVLADAQLTDTIQRLPQGVDTAVGELGSRLSGGERQRVGVARAFAKGAPLLLVDEATAALDTLTEAGLVSAIDAVRGQYTTVLVTHRPAAVSIADQVVVMADGEIVEQGTPTQLAAIDGHYARIRRRWEEAARWRV